MWTVFQPTSEEDLASLPDPVASCPLGALITNFRKAFLGSTSHPCSKQHQARCLNQAPSETHSFLDGNQARSHPPCSAPNHNLGKASRGFFESRPSQLHGTLHQTVYKSITCTVVEISSYSGIPASKLLQASVTLLRNTISPSPASVPFLTPTPTVKAEEGHIKH